MKKVSAQIAFIIVALIINLKASAQVTVGLTYGELKKAYYADQDFSGWEDSQANDGTPYVSYTDKTHDLLICSYFNNDVVSQYKLIGETKRWANTWGEYADKTFARQGHGVWFDYASKRKWILVVKDNGFTSFVAINLDD